MAKYFLIGEDGDDAVWLIDLEQRTVEKFEDEELTVADVEDDDLISNFGQVRRKGFSVISGVNLAVAAHSRTAAAGHVRYRTPQ